MAENKLKFKYGDSEYDANKLAKYLHENVEDYAKAQGWSSEDTQAFIQSTNDLIGRIQSGDIDSLNYQGQIHSNSGDFQNMPEDYKHLINWGSGNKRKGIIRTGKSVDYNGLAVSYLNKAITALGSDSKTKFNNSNLYTNWKNEFFGGNEPGDNLEEGWLNLDEKDSNGNRTSATNRLSKMAQFLDKYSNSDEINNLDFTGSAFSDANSYRQALKQAADAARSGNLDEFYRAYSAASGDLTHAKKWFATTSQDNTTTTESSTPQQETQIDQILKTYRENLTKTGLYTPDVIDKLVEAERKKYQKFGEYQQRKALEEEDWDNYWNNIHTATNKHSYDFSGWKWEGDNHWLGTRGLDEGDEIPGKLNKSDVDRVWNNFLKTGIVAPGNDQHIMRAKLYYDDPKKNTAEYAPTTKPNLYIIKATLKNGGAWAYNTSTKRLTYLNGTETVRKLIKDSWLKNRYQGYEGMDEISQQLMQSFQNNPTSSEEVPSQKQGGSLLPMFKSGAELEAMAARHREQQYNQALQEEASSRGMSEDAVKVGHSRAFSSNDRLKNERGIQGNLSNSDITRLSTLAADVASIGASYIPVYGNAVAGVLGIGSTLGDLYADATDDSVSSGEMWGNLGTNAGLTLLSLIPGGGTGKFGKVIRGIKTAIPLIMTGIAGTSLATDPRVQKTLSKFGNGKGMEDITTDDWKNLTMILKVAAGGHNAAKVTAGKIAPHLATNKSPIFRHTIRNIGEGLGRWGYNAYGSKGIYAKDTAAWNLTKNTVRRNGTLLENFKKPALSNNNSESKVSYLSQEMTEEQAIKLHEKWKSARKSGKTVEQAKTAVIDEYRKMFNITPDELPAKIKLPDGKTFGEFIKGVTAEPDGTIKVQTEAGERKMTNDQWNQLINSFKDKDASAITDADQTAFNTAYQNMFKKPAVEMPELDFGNVKDYSDWRPNWTKRHQNPELNLPKENKLAKLWNFNKDNSLMVDGNIQQGQRNAALISQMNDIYGDRGKGFFANNFEYINGISGPIKTRTTKLTEHKAAKITNSEKDNLELLTKLFSKVDISTKVKQEELKSKLLDLRGKKGIGKNASLGEIIQKLNESNLRNEKYRVKSGKNAGARIHKKGPDGELKSIDAVIRDFLNEKKSQQNAAPSRISHFYNQEDKRTFTSKNPYGTGKNKLNTSDALQQIENTLGESDLITKLNNSGKVDNYLKFLKSVMSKSKDNNEVMSHLKSKKFIEASRKQFDFKRGGKLKALRTGGIIKMQIGGRSGITSNPNTWNNDIFSKLSDALFKDLSSGKFSMNDFNNYQSQHAASYRAASANGNDFYKTAYVPNPENESVAEQQRLYQKLGYNDIAIAPGEQNGRYTNHGTNLNLKNRDSKEGGWLEDNLYSGKHDDRRFGRKGDFDENSDMWKSWQNRLGTIGYSMYLDPSDNYYKLKKSDTSNSPQAGLSENFTSNQSQDGLVNPATLEAKNPEKVDIFKTLKEKTGVTPEALYRYFTGNATNARMNRMNRERRQVAHKVNTPEVSKNIYGDTVSQNAMYNEAADIENKFSQMANNIADPAMRAQLLAEGHAKGTDYRKQGDVAYNTPINKTREDRFNLMQQNNANNTDTTNYNRGVDAAHNNALLDSDLAYENMKQQNKNTLSLSIEQNKAQQEAKEEAKKQQLINLRNSALQSQLQDAITNDPELLKIKENEQKLRSSGDTTGADSAYEDYLKKHRELTQKYNPIYWKSLAGLYDIDYDYNKSNPFTQNGFSFNTGSYTQSIKNGGKISDDGPARTGNKNAELFRKLLKDYQDTNNKALDRLSRGTILAIKKALG